jgi:hypothetical protein
MRRGEGARRRCNTRRERGQGGLEVVPTSEGRRYSPSEPRNLAMHEKRARVVAAGKPVGSATIETSSQDTDLQPPGSRRTREVGYDGPEEQRQRGLEKALQTS